MTKPLMAFLIVPLLVGCGSSNPTATSAASQTSAVREMETKMNTMTPQQRADYLRAHPEEIAKIVPSTQPPSPGAPK